MDKKILLIIILSLIIIGLIWIIFSGKNNLDAVIGSLRIQQSELIRSNGIIQGELIKSTGYNQELETDNIELESIIDNLTTGSKKTESDLTEYGNINNDLAEFIRQAKTTD